MPYWEAGIRLISVPDTEVEAVGDDPAGCFVDDGEGDVIDGDALDDAVAFHGVVGSIIIEEQRRCLYRIEKWGEGDLRSILSAGSETLAEPGGSIRNPPVRSPPVQFC
jgi:hypothetical protein